MQEVLVSSTGESETGFRNLSMLDIEFLEKTGIVTPASVDRVKILIDYFEMSRKIKRKEIIYIKLAEKHHKSYYTIRNIVVTYLRNC